MSLTLTLTAETEARLRARAAAAGKDPAVLAAQMVEEGVGRPSLEELLAPLRAQFEAGGAGDDELVRQVTEARDAYRKGL